ncbi:MAG: cytochrome c [Acidobacteriia bacterium]|nr:cytochrome c [Terriglobia bacterium]
MKMKLLAGGAVLIGLGAVSAWAGVPEGKELYAKSCKSCHGAEGQGNPTIAKMMKVEIKPLGPQSDGDVKDAILKGKGKMKPIASLNAKQADDVAAFVKTLKK